MKHLVKLSINMLILSSLLVGCSNDDEDIPKENRVSILKNASEKEIPQSASQISAIPSPVTNTDWNQSFGLSFKDIGNLNAVDTLDNLTKIDIGDTKDGDREITMQPVISAGKAFFFTVDSQLVAIDLETSEVLWKKEILVHSDIDDNPRGGGLAADGGYVFIATSSGVLAAFDAQEGKQIWRLDNKIPFSAAPTLSEGSLYVIDRDNRVQVVDVRTGKATWDYRGLPEPVAYSRVAGASVIGPVLIAPFTSGEIIAISTETQKPAWSQTIIGGGLNPGGMKFNTISGEVVISDKKVFLSVPSGLSLALSGETGKVIWQHEVGSSRTMLSVGSVIYLLDTHSVLYALDKETGELYWKKNLPKYEDTDDKTGIIEWTSPIMSNGKIFLFSNIGKSFIIDPINGDTISKSDDSPTTVIDPLIADGKLYVYSSDGSVYIYK